MISVLTGCPSLRVNWSSSNLFRTTPKQMLMLIIVPASALRCDIFSVFHATPSAGLMGIYKTFHHIVSISFGITVGKSLPIGASNAPTTSLPMGLLLARNIELVFSWPLCCPFYTLHVDLWRPGEIVNYSGETYLMNVMCDLISSAGSLVIK